MKEKCCSIKLQTKVIYEENKLKSFHSDSSMKSSYRIYQKEQVGIYYHVGEISDEEGYARAQKNLLERPRPYPFELETGVRKRDKTERILKDKEVLEIARECMQYLIDRYPQFIFRADFTQTLERRFRTNEKGMDYANTDCAVSVNIHFKHVDCKDIRDGGFGFGLREYNKNVFYKMADDFLGNFERQMELPEEIIVDMQYYELMDRLSDCLDGARIAHNNSLLSGKIGEKVFSEDFTVFHDVSDEECWFNNFWDGDGCVTEKDKKVFIDKGVVITGHANKLSARGNNIPHTCNAGENYLDIPDIGGLNLRILRSRKTIKELLDGRYCVIPVLMGGGGFSEDGSYTVPVRCALLSDGEKILGKLPPFTMVSSLFDMFGKDFIGVGADNPIFNDKQILFKIRKSNIL